MTKQEIGALASRILAVYALMQALFMLQFLVLPATAVEENAAAAILGLSAVAFTLVLAAVLWARSDRIGAELVSAGEENEGQPAVWEEDRWALAMMTVGLVVVVTTIPRLVALIVALASVPDAAALARPLLNGVPTLVQLAVGLYLLLGIRGVVGVAKAARKKMVHYTDRAD